MSKPESPDAGLPTDGQRPAIPARFFTQLTIAAVLLATLFFASALPDRLGLPSLALVVTTPTPTPTSTPVVTPTPRPLLVYLPTPTPLPTATPIMERYQVGNTGGSGVWLRRTPRMDDRHLIWPEGAVMLVVGEDVENEGRMWKHVRDPNGNTGYIPAQYLVPAPE